MTVTLLLVAVIICLIAALFITINVLKKQIAEKNRLKEEVETQQQNVIYLYNHAKEIAEIHAESTKLEKEIKNAKSDEEIIDIINTVIANNNSKL